MARSRHIGVYIALFALIIISSTSILRSHTSFYFSTKAAMSVTHTVLFQFKQDAKTGDVKAVGSSALMS